MYEELVKRLRSHNGWALNETLDEAADAIEELQNACEEAYSKGLLEGGIAQRSEDEKWLPKWIPVTERLPENGEYVLCFCRANIVCVLRRDKDGDWYENPTHAYMSGFVTHWMPIPEPPKEGE